MNKYYMQTYCKKTCGWCPKCGDISDKCSSMDCDDKMSEEFLRKNCRLTCGICVKPTLPPPTPPRPTFKVIPAGNCGVPKVKTVKIIGGVNAKKGAWPWQVLIRLFGGTHCGGTIVSPFWVVTAAHCMYEKEPLIEDFKVVTGEDDFVMKNGTETSIGLEKIIVHKGYNPATLNNDIALLKLDRPAPFGTYVGTACLPDQDDDVPVGTECTITGWGKIERFGSMHHKLQQAELPIVDNLKCQNLNTNTTGIQITDKMMCAGYGPEKITSGCHGDSGGPLVCRKPGSNQWYLQGAVSWGSSRCDTRDAYTVFARISKLRNWIDENVQNN